MDETVAENDQFIQIVKPFMITSGIWKLHLNIRKFYQEHYHFYAICFQGIFVVFLSLLLLKLIQLYLIEASSDALYSNLAILLSSLAIGVKFMIYQKNNVPQMFGRIQEEELEVLQSDDDDVKTFYLNQVKLCRIINMGIMIYVFFAMGSMFFISLFTYLQEDKIVSKTDKQQLEESFMYPFWLPFKEKSHIMIVICLNILFATVAIFIYCTSQMMFATLMLYATTQLRILQIRVSKLHFDNSDDVDEQNATNVYAALRSLATRHSLLIK
ncbi:hypothetical protein GWI33_015002 [Rhynchophorus ferrugineus]|uniref:Odorant receptor n=1 Tax=Rhynchophorus ferrugineus TaxID=354439 RepID=A0A834I429_RHYFE|nr:hypothetical protein GWI33_015002 [Rhynchophorus ferrugineus]